jgi:hypothetical protein
VAGVKVDEQRPARGCKRGSVVCVRVSVSVSVCKCVCV